MRPDLTHLLEAVRKAEQRVANANIDFTRAQDLLNRRAASRHMARLRKGDALGKQNRDLRRVGLAESNLRQAERDLANVKDAYKKLNDLVDEVLSPGEEA